MRKEHGSSTFLVRLEQRSGGIASTELINVPNLPRLPSVGIEEVSTNGQIDASITPRTLENFKVFLREFVAMHLIPWMEKNVLDWIETVGPLNRLAGK